ncbi:hypothetical protein NYO98_06530 [Nocardioides sp. STR2]|uniref:Cupin domain-containing protein n=1 Tax=Nocardioides pini TaxID=2975053 RepID=A0ABT4CAD7_9ACTN|nr:hypothetical protein [Nocardioides pini]MCY4725927.1 hypothetical protein [Nocardioides pini]
MGQPSWNDGMVEMLYTHAGRGSLWAHDGTAESTVQLRPGRAVLIPPGARYQYRSALSADLTMFVATTPRFDASRHHTTDAGPWRPDLPAEHDPAPDRAAGPLLTADLPLLADYAAPDGSEIRLLPECDAGGLSHCIVRPGGKTKTVQHRTVVELWVTLDGAGELARWVDGPDASPLHTPLTYGVAVDIETGVPFQFTATGADPLRILILTMPRWPGPQEADPSVNSLDAWPT